MRKLFLVPLIHSRADLGKTGEILARIRKKADKEKSILHDKMMKTFWSDIEHYMDGIDKKKIVIYQDGLVADGELGAKIIRQGASLGSRNFRLVSDLMEQGATIRKTENISIVKQEHTLLMNIFEPGPLIKKALAYMKYLFKKKNLLKLRDKFMAGKINTTLKKDEIGILFIGLLHDAHTYLEKDIQIVEVKSLDKVRKYYKALMGRGKIDDFKNNFRDI